MPATKFSRYAFASIHEDDDGNIFYDVPTPISRRRSFPARRFMVGTGDTLWSLAWKQYKEMLSRRLNVRPTSFFWAIAQANDVVDATAPLRPGTKMVAPSITELRTEVLRPPKERLNRSTVL